MPRLEITIPTPDGDCPATLHVPDGGGPAPAVIFYADAGGVRETMRVMADRLAASGYVTLLPDFYYRSGDWAPFDVATVFSDPAERGRLMEMVQSLTADAIARDAGAFLDFLGGRPEVSGTTVGTTGYCMGGRSSLIVAERHPERVGAAASFHAAGSPPPTIRTARTCWPIASRLRCMWRPRGMTTRSQPTSSSG